jgi:hypothetical protein
LIYEYLRFRCHKIRVLLFNINLYHSERPSKRKRRLFAFNIVAINPQSQLFKNNSK